MTNLVQGASPHGTPPLKLRHASAKASAVSAIALAKAELPDTRSRAPLRRLTVAERFLLRADADRLIDEAAHSRVLPPERDSSEANRQRGRAMCASRRERSPRVTR